MVIEVHYYMLLYALNLTEKRGSYIQRGYAVHSDECKVSYFTAVQLYIYESMR